MKTVVLTDSSAYIPESALQGFNLKVIPLWLLWENDSLRDGIDIDPPAFYQRLKSSKTLPTSSQPTVIEFENFFRAVAQEADQILCVLVSSRISGTITNAQAAIARLPEIKILLVDALSSSMGLGFAVLAAARSIAKGKTIEEAAADAERMRDDVNLMFVVDTLEYLHKGGRIGGAKRLLGTALNVKPLLHFFEGQVEPLSQARTKRKAIAQLLDTAEERLAGRQMAEAAVVDIDSIEEGDQVAGMVKERFGLSKVLRSPVSPVVGTHVGPGAIGMAFHTLDDLKAEL